MNAKFAKYIFIITIVILVLSGIHMVYIKNIGEKENKKNLIKETKISKEIIIGITNFDTINPIYTKNFEIQQLTKLIYEPLVNITEDFNTKPGIAEEWSKIDEKTYILKIDENKKWSNGKSVTIEDIQFTIDKINLSESIYKENVNKIEKIEDIGNNIIKIYLTQKIDFFEYLLCFPIIQEESYSEEKVEGIGEYRITDISNNKIIIQSKDKKIIVKIFNNAVEMYNQFSKEDIDIIITQNTNYEDYIGNIGVEESLITGREFYYISCENMDNIEERKMLNEAINKEKLIYDLYNKKYIAVNFPLEYGSYLNKEKLQDEGKKNIVLKRTLTISSSQENIKVAEAIQKQLLENNIKTVILNYENAKADLVLKKVTIPITPQIDKYFQDEEIQKQIQRVMNIEDKEELKEEYGNIIDKYYEENPFISLYFNSYIILHTNKLKGNFAGNWYNIFYNIGTWYKEI